MASLSSLAKSTLNNVRRNTTSTIRSTSSALRNTTSTLKNATRATTNRTSNLSNTLNTAKKTVSSLTNAVKKSSSSSSRTLSTLTNSLTKSASKTSNLTNAFKTVTSTVKNNNVLSSINSIVKGNKSSGVSTLTNLVNKYTSGKNSSLTNTFKTLKNNITGNTSSVKNSLLTSINSVFSNNSKLNISNAINALRNNIQSRTGGTGVLSGLLSNAKGLLNNSGTGVSKIANLNVFGGLKNLITNVKSNITGGDGTSRIDTMGVLGLSTVLGGAAERIQNSFETWKSKLGALVGNDKMTGVIESSSSIASGKMSELFSNFHGYAMEMANRLFGISEETEYVDDSSVLGETQYLEYNNDNNIDEGIAITSTNDVNDNISATPSSSNNTYGTWTGSKLTKQGGVNYGPSGKETWYNDGTEKSVVYYAQTNGYGVKDPQRIANMSGEYWVREDGVRMLGDYVMVAANLDTHPRGSLVETSLGTGVVVDTGGFAKNNPNQVDIFVTW